VAALTSQMIEAAQIPRRNTAKRLLIKVDNSFQAFYGADEKSDRLIAREEPYTVEKKVRAKEGIVALAGALLQFFDLSTHRHDGFAST
jgi:hypothetical protein